MNLKALGLKIKELRQLRGQSQDGLAGSSGVARNSINEIEQGRGNPTVGTLEALSSALGEPLIELAGQAPSPNQKSMLQTIWSAWPSATPEVKVFCLYLLTDIPDYLSLLPEGKRAKVLNAARAMGLKPPKEFA